MPKEQNERRAGEQYEVDRSTGRGTIRVHPRLKRGRAMTLCWIANTPGNAASVAPDMSNGPDSPLSIVLGSGTFATSPIA